MHNELTAEQIIHIFENSNLQGSFTPEGLTAAYVAALAALHAEQERLNPQPLTLEELREMVNQPVWVEVTDHSVFADPNDDFDAWGMVRPCLVRIWDFNRADLVTITHDFDDYGKTWLAYRTKPEGGTK